MFKYYEAIKKRDPNLTSIWQMLTLYPGIKALFIYRIANLLYRCHFKWLANYLMYLVRLKYSIDISPQAIIGKNLLIDHGTGVVIGSTTIIGDDCTIYQGVTLGSKNAGQISDKNLKRHPTIKNRVMIGSGAKVLGNITIGNDVIIGANAVVTEDIEDNIVVVGIKYYQKRRQNGKI